MRVHNRVCTGMVLLVGVVLGASSWAIVPLVSGSIEPFDSDTGFYLGQFMLSVVALYLGFRHGLVKLSVYIPGVYLGVNLYPYMFGSGESEAWALLGLLTTIALCLFPVIAGVVGVVLKLMYVKYISSTTRSAQ